MGNILVLGASGFVGAAIKKRLERENTVYGTYFHSKAAYETEARMEFLDVRDPLAPAILYKRLSRNGLYQAFGESLPISLPFTDSWQRK